MMHLSIVAVVLLSFKRMHFGGHNGVFWINVISRRTC